ncbi:hypothetical protein [Pseudorhodoplanes sp.]|nr:hypothetical protein [Pseudorhodoplanes sp.]HWV43199.1 hypothetical protein [Pseudorhodoplanes sp.]
MTPILITPSLYCACTGAAQKDAARQVTKTSRIIVVLGQGVFMF